MRLRRKLARAALVVVVLWAVFAAWLLGTAWYAVEGYRPDSIPAETALVLSPGEYDARIDAHPRPYVFELVAPGGGGVLVFGATHTKRTTIRSSSGCGSGGGRSRPR